MGFGNLDRLITILKWDTTDMILSNGERYRNWSDVVVNLWAGLEYSGGDEDYEANQRTASNEIRFKVRYYPGITEKMRILMDSVYYDITHITEVGRGKYLILKAEKKD